jgi:hypothetical protein
MLAKYVPGDIKYIFTKFYRHISTNNEANRKFIILISNFSTSLWRFKLKMLMLNSLHLKRSEDYNLNLITVGKLNIEVNSYVPFWQTTILNEQNVSFPLYLQRKECFITAGADSVKIWFFWRKIVIFHMKYPKNFARPPLKLEKYDFLS